LRDVTQGQLLLALSFVTMVLYVWALFLAPQDIQFLGRTISDWALLIPVMIIVFLFLVVVAWIGWAMATTPPPIPLPGKESKDNDEKENKGTV
jgi:predicted DNA-binding transcriptional regulator